MNKDAKSDALRKGDIGIITAAREGKLDAVTQLIENNGVSVDFQECEGSPTPLMIASKFGHAGIVKYLLGRGATIDKQDGEGRTALINAALNNRAECLTLLMEHGADPNLFSKNGWTALYIAANKGFKEIANILLFAYGQNNPTSDTEYHTLNVNMAIQNTVGGTVLMVACMQGHYEIVVSLIGNGADVNARDKQNWTALMKAADKGHRKIVQLLLVNGADVSAAEKTGFTALHLAAKSGWVEVVGDLLSCDGIDVNAVDQYGRTPAFLAARYNFAAVLMALLADVKLNLELRDRDGRTALDVSTTHTMYQIAAALIRDIGTDTALSHAQRLIDHALGPPESVERTQTQPPLLDRPTHESTPLMVAAATGQLGVLDQLIGTGAHIDQQDKAGLTALHHATRGGRVEAVRLLLDRGANKDLCTKNGWSPLYWATERGFIDIMTVLLNFGARCDTQNTVGGTALMIASKLGNVAAVQLLLNHGAAANIRNDTGYTALRLAAEELQAGAMLALLHHV